MTKTELEEENKTLKEQIESKNKSFEDLKEVINLGHYLRSKWQHYESFRKLIVKNCKKKLKKYGFLSESIERILVDVLGDVDLVEQSDSKIFKALIDNDDIQELIKALLDYAAWWDSVEGINSKLYFEGKFDKEEK